MLLLRSLLWSYLGDPPRYCLSFARFLNSDVYFSAYMYKYLQTLSYSISPEAVCIIIQNKHHLRHMTCPGSSPSSPSPRDLSLTLIVCVEYILCGSSVTL